MPYYHNLITDKSWKVLQDLKKSYDFILIGGWAVFLWTGALKSKDIDIVLEYDELEKIKNSFEVSKNERLAKYEARKGEVEIDIYIPFYSNPGLPAEDLKSFTAKLSGFTTVEKEVLAVLKQKAMKERSNSPKGRKDLIDLVNLFRLLDFDWKRYKEIVKKYSQESYSKFIEEAIGNTREIPELALNIHKMAGFKKKILAGFKD